MYRCVVSYAPLNLFPEPLHPDTYVFAVATSVCICKQLTQLFGKFLDLILYVTFSDICFFNLAFF